MNRRIRRLVYTRPMPASAWFRVLQDVGRTVHDVRVSLGWSQRELARRSGVSQSRISRIERGRLIDLPISVIDRLFVTLGVRYWIGTERPQVARPPADHVHARCSGFVARRLVTHGWLVEREVEVGGDRSRGWIDILAFDPRSRALLVIEVKTEIHDIGAIERTINWYRRESLGAARRFGWRPARVSSALLVLQSSVNDRRIVATSAVFAAAFPGRAAELRTLIDGSGVPAEDRFLAMIDPRSRRSAWLRSTPSENRRSTAPYADYIDAARQMERVGTVTVVRPRRRRADLPGASNRHE
jgi:transcriptional regulator with XRE-family HTH domain